jgi:hypothetical protein
MDFREPYAEGLEHEQGVDDSRSPFGRINLWRRE